MLFPSCLAREYCTIQQPTLVCHTKGCLLSKQLSTCLFVLSHQLVFKPKCQCGPRNTPGSGKPGRWAGGQHFPWKLPCPARELEPPARVLSRMAAGQPSAHGYPRLWVDPLSLWLRKLEVDQFSDLPNVSWVFPWPASYPLLLFMTCLLPSPALSLTSSQMYPLPQSVMSCWCHVSSCVCHVISLLLSWHMCPLTLEGSFSFSMTGEYLILQKPHSNILSFQRAWLTRCSAASNKKPT